MNVAVLSSVIPWLAVACAAAAIASAPLAGPDDRLKGVGYLVVDLAAGRELISRLP